MSVLDQPHWWYWKQLLMDVHKKNKQGEEEVGDLAASGRNQRLYLNKPYQHVYVSKREAESLYWFTQGKGVREVAETLEISKRTVEYYLKNVKLKLSCRTRHELLTKVIANGFCELYQEHFVA